MTITVTPIQNNQTFGAWLSTTNRLANIISQNTVTADTSLGGSVTTGNVFVNGHFGASYLYAENALIGGNVSSNGTLNLAANAAFKYASSNIAIVTANSTSTNVAISAENTAILSNTLYITASVNAIGVVAIANTLSVANAATFNDVINVEDIIPSVNAAFDLGSTTNLFDGAFVKTVNFEAGSANSTIYTGTANNSNNLNNQPASFYTNATNITTGTLAMDRLGSSVVNTTGNFTVAGNINFTAANNFFSAGLSSGSNVVISTTQISVGNSIANVTVSNNQINIDGGTVNSTIYTGTANNSNNLNNQPASFYTNATNITTGTLSTDRLPATINFTTANIVTLTANNSNGDLGQVLTSNGTGIYWGTPTTVAISNGLTSTISSGIQTISVRANSGISTTLLGGVFVNANNGVVANSFGVFVRANTGIVVNSFGVFVNSSYIGTLTANNTTNFNGQAASYYANATNITTGTLATARLPATINATTINVTTANIVTLTANNSNGTLGQVLTSNGTGIYWGSATGGVSSVGSGDGLTGGPITSSGSLSVLANTGIVANATGVFVNSSYIGTLTANNTTNFNGQPASYYTNATNLSTGTLATARLPATINATTINVTTANIVTLTANNSNGTLGQVLLSNGTGIYWGSSSGGVSSVATGNGLTGGTITTTGTVSVIANTGIIANATGVYVNSAYIGTLTANNATFLNGASAAAYVNTSGSYTFTGLNTFQANLHTGNTTVNTQISNSSIRLANSTTTTTVGITDIRVGNTETNVIISNTVSTFGGNVSVIGVANFSQTPIVNNRSLYSNVAISRAYTSYTSSVLLTSVIPYDDTTPAYTEGTQILSVSLIPRSPTNKLRVRVEATGSTNTGGPWSLVLVDQTAPGAGAIVRAATGTETGIPNAMSTCVIEHEFVPDAAVIQGQQMNFGINAGPASLSSSLCINGNGSRKYGGVMAATLTVEEILQ